MARLTISSLDALGDGYPLEVARYEPYSKAGTHFTLVINAGAGVPKSLYEPFACWLADQGISVITYDYRGIGGSRPKSLRGLRASIRDWGSKDCAAVLRFVQLRFPASKLWVISHSIGAVVTGFVTNPPKIEKIVMLSPHTGLWRDYAPGSKIRMFMLWHWFMPVITRLCGFFPGRAFGFPEDLPFHVATEWSSRRFSSNRGCESTAGTFVHLHCDALLIRPVDDPFATPEAATRIRRQFPNVRFTDLPLARRPHTAAIGHFGFFKPRNRETLWPIVLEWLSQQQICGTLGS